MSRPTRTAPVTVEVEADPAAVIAVVADPARIPVWAPGFADAVHAEDDGGWSATKDGRRFSLRVAVDRAAGTVDILRVVAPGIEGGAHLDVTPRRAGGSVVAMTVPVAPDADPAVAAATVRAELRALETVLASG